MSSAPTEIGRLNEASLQKEVQEINKFADQLQKEAQGDPRLPTCMALKNSALQSLNQAILSLTMPGGADMASSAMERALEKYNQTVSIRADIIRDKLLTMNAGLKGELEAQLPKDADQNDPSVRALTELIKIADDLTTTERNPFFLQNTAPNGKISIAVSMDRVNAHRATLEKIKKTGTLLSPTIGSSIGRLERSLDFVASTDPVRNGYSTLHKEISKMSGSFDSRPLRLIAVIGGGLLTALGGGIMIKDRIIKGEWGQVTWPMYLWAGVTALALKPSLLMGGTAQSIKGLQELNDIGKQGLMAIGAFRGKEGALAIEEVTELQKNGKLRPLLSQPALSNALIGSVTGGNTPLSKVLATLKSDAERGQTLRELAKQSSNKMGDVLAELVRTRDEIKFS